MSSLSTSIAPAPEALVMFNPEAVKAKLDAGLRAYQGTKWIEIPRTLSKGTYRPIGMEKFLEIEDLDEEIGPRLRARFGEISSNKNHIIIPISEVQHVGSFKPYPGAPITLIIPFSDITNIELAEQNEVIVISLGEESQLRIGGQTYWHPVSGELLSTEW